MLILDGTLGENFPTWTTAGRPASPVAGQTGYNTTLNYLEVYNGTTWLQGNIPSTGLTVGSGGTGATTLTANNVILGNGTSAVTFVAPGSSGNILKSDGTTWTSGAAAAGGFSNMTVFTSPGTFTTPATVTQVKVSLVGGGGGGSGPGGWGGGGGGGAIYVGPVTASTPYAVTVGAGGPVGGTGGTTSFGALCSATGGANDVGGSGTAGTFQTKGDGCAYTGIANSPYLSGANGGSSMLGGGSPGLYPARTQVVGYGGGGGAGGATSSPTLGVGGGGVVIVEY